MTRDSRRKDRNRRPDAWLRYESVVVEREEILAEDLVRLRVQSLGEIRTEVGRLAAVLTVTHPARTRDALASAAACPACAITARRLIADHERFQLSADQLDWFWKIVVREDHGGNRQALGQYWKVVLEAFSLHLDEEMQLEAHRRAERAAPHWLREPPAARAKPGDAGRSPPVREPEQAPPQRP